METSVSWEGSAKKDSGLPHPIEKILHESIYKNPKLIFGVAEHQVDLPGGKHASQCDVWALTNSTAGQLSLSVEAKANEPFGKGNESLSQWLISKDSEKSKENREERWAFIRKHLPETDNNLYSEVSYQILHRCAAAVIEAKRLGLNHAVFLVQAFDSPQSSFEEYSKFCVALNAKSERGKLVITKVDRIDLGVGWVDCPLATDKEISAVV
jgi:hypothetical protein